MFLVDVADVGGRLQYVFLNSRCGEISPTGLVFVSAFDVPDNRGVDGEMGFLTGNIGGWVAGAAGQYESGEQWMVILQQAPGASGAEAIQLRDDAVELTKVEGLRQTSVFGADDISDYCASSVRAYGEDLTPEQLDSRLGALKSVPLSVLIKGLAVELTGYPLASMVENYPANCGFPGRPHDCHADVIDDVMTDWLERGAALGE